MNKTIRILLGAVLLGTTISYANAQKVVEMKLGHFGPENHPATIAAKQFADNVAKRTHGAIRVTVYPNNALGNPPEVLEQAMLGAIDMSLSGQDQLAKHVKLFDTVGIPFAFKDYATADKVLDGEFKKWAAPELEKVGLVYLSSWEWGFRQITNSKHPINKPEDIRGLKIRTPPALTYQATIDALGGQVQTINFSELVMAMRTGVVDGQENPIAVIYDLKLYESQKYVAMVNYTYSSMTHVISKKVWDGLTKEQQTIIREESDRSAHLMRKLVRENEARQIEEMKKMGVQFTTPDLGPFKAAMGPAYAKIKANVGEQNFKTFMDMVDRANK